MQLGRSLPEMFSRLQEDVDQATRAFRRQGTQRERRQSIDTGYLMGRSEGARCKTPQARGVNVGLKGNRRDSFFLKPDA